MKIIACVDDQMGLMFNQRRQSQDRIVRERIKALNETIYMNEYSYRLYKDILDDVVIDEDFLEKGQNHYCLVENMNLKDYQNDIDEIILFKWNRVYPADFVLDLDLSAYQLISQYQFVGSSHEVTQEVYRKEK